MGKLVLFDLSPRRFHRRPQGSSTHCFWFSSSSSTSSAGASSIAAIFSLSPASSSPGSMSSSKIDSQNSSVALSSSSIPHSFGPSLHPLRLSCLEGLMGLVAIDPAGQNPCYDSRYFRRALDLFSWRLDVVRHCLGALRARPVHTRRCPLSTTISRRF